MTEDLGFSRMALKNLEVQRLRFSHQQILERMQAPSICVSQDQLTSRKE